MLTDQRPVNKNLYLKNANAEEERTLFGDDDLELTADAELKHDLNLAPSPTRLPTSPLIFCSSRSNPRSRI